MGDFARVCAGWRAWFRRLALALLLAGSAGTAAAAPLPLIAAASDLKFALDDALAVYRQASGQAVRAIYGSSGNFAAQIRQGAPFDIFMSADEALVAELAALGHTRDAGKLYAIGRVALFVPHGSALAADASLGDLGRALVDGRLRHFAIANPAHAPYGRAAREALVRRGLWTAIEPRLVLGENVAQAAQFALTGAAEAGIIALSLARSPAFAGAGDHVVLPTDLHSPLRQRMVVLERAVPAAEAVYAWLGGEQARAIFARYGFTLPDD